MRAFADPTADPPVAVGRADSAAGFPRMAGVGPAGARRGTDGPSGDLCQRRDIRTSVLSLIRRGSCSLQHEVDHKVLCGLDLWSPLAVLQPAACAASRNGVTPCPAITSPTNMDELSSAASTGSGSSSSMPMGARVAHQVAAGGIRRPGAHPPLTEVREQIQKCGDPRLVGVVDDKFADPRL
jgi:hypothetical protein